MTNSTNNEILDTDEHTEREDGEKVDIALQSMQNADSTAAETILLDVCSRSPDKYQYEYVKNGTRYIKFWNMQQFIAYCNKQQENIVWIISAYPRACYYLGHILIDKKSLGDAFHWLYKGVSMEPHNPLFYTEIGFIMARLGQHQDALNSYRRAVELSVQVGKHEQAVALRGMGVQLVDLQRLDDAEECLKMSLELEPSSLSENELRYITDLRKKLSGHLIDRVGRE